MKEFRIKLDLSSIFDDFRASACTLVSDDIKTIKDLQHRISKLFTISQSLLLFSNGDFLPDEEWVKILKENEVVKVVENGKQESKKSKVEEFNSCELKVKKRKKNKSHVDLDLSNCTEDNGEEAVQKEILYEPKNNKKKRKIDDTTFDCLDGLLNVDEEEKCNKKVVPKEELKNQEFLLHKCVVFQRKKVEPMPISTEARVIKSIKHINPESLPLRSPTFPTAVKVKEKLKSSEMDNSSATKVWPPVRPPTPLADFSEEGGCFVQNNQQGPSTSSVIVLDGEDTSFRQKDQQRLVASPTTVSEKITSELKDHEEPPVFNECSGYVEDMLVNRSLIIKQLPRTDQNKIVIHSNNSLISTQSTDISQSEVDSDTATQSTASSFTVPKRKRKRVRKRKRNSTAKAVDIPYQCATPPLPGFKFSKLKSTTKNIHIKFDDDDFKSIEAAEIPLLESDEIPNSEDKKEMNLIVEKKSAPVLIAKTPASLLNGSTSKEQAKGTEIDKKVSLIVDMALCEKEILTYPIMTTNPKVGDIIAFKKFKLTEDYTPALSDFILGKVFSFDENTKDLCLDVLEGAEHCYDPKGKFSLENPEDEDNKDMFVRLNMRDLLQPRMIFP